MNQNLRAVMIIAVVAAAFTGGVYLVGKRRSAAATPYANCTPGPGEQCASDLFLKDYDQMVELRHKVQPCVNPTPDAAPMCDQLTGILDRLSRQVPQGYSFNEAKRRYVVMTPAPVAPAPAPPAPAPPPKK